MLCRFFDFVSNYFLDEEFIDVETVDPVPDFLTVPLEPVFSKPTGVPLRAKALFSARCLGVAYERLPVGACPVKCADSDGKNFHTLELVGCFTD